MPKRHLLITGVNGFIGSYLAGYFLKNGYRVTGISRTRPENPGFSWIQADLSGPFSIPEADVVVHAAAETRQTEDENACWRNNVQASQNLINRVLEKKIKKFVFLSSVSVYGRIDAGVVDENTPVQHPGAYGRTKHSVERMLEKCSGDFSSAALRLPAVVGPGAKNIWLAGMLQNMMENKEVGLFNPESLFNNLVHVLDLAVFIENLCEKEWTGFENLLLGSAHAIRIREVAALMAGKTGYQGAWSARGGGKKSFLLSFEKARKLFGYDPMSVKEAVERFAGENKEKVKA